MVHFEQWEGFEGRIWREEVNVRDFIQKNYKPYAGDERFLAGPTEATDKLWGILQKLQKEERAKGGVLDMETHVVSGLTAYGAGYISEADKALEQIVGLQNVSRNTEGSGLGLSIAKDLVQLQGGEFKLYLDGDLFKVTIEFRMK